MRIKLGLLPALRRLVRMAVLLGGRVAEKVVFGTAISGAENDPTKVTKLAPALGRVHDPRGRLRSEHRPGGSD
jgi:hypothetical protein